MRTRYGVSPWIDAVPSARRPDYPRLRAEHTVDVAIVGAGLTGTAVALACATAGLKAVLIEEGRLGQGAAGRAPGFLLPDPGVAFRDLAEAHGLRAARHAFEAWRKAALDAAALLRRLRVPCGLESRDLLTVATATGERGLRREHDAREQAGLSVRWVTAQAARKASAPESMVAAVGRGEGFVIDPFRAALGVARAAVARGAVIAELTAVRRVKAGSAGVEVVVDGGLVRAGTVVVATGAPTSLFAPLRRHFKARETYAVLTEPLPAATRKQVVPPGVLLQGAELPALALARTQDHRLLLTGGDQAAVPARKHEATRIQRTGQLMYELLLMYPGIAGLRPAFGWEVPYSTTSDGLPYIGAHRNYPRHLFALGGHASATASFLAATLVARAIRGKAEKSDAVFGWTR